MTTVTAGHQTIAVTHVAGKRGALDTRCPHHGGRPGEGSVEDGLLGRRTVIALVELLCDADLV